MKQAFLKIQTTKGRVEFLLETRSETRDCDNLLISLYWFYESDVVLGDLNAIEFLRMMKDGKFTSSESIRRNRQKIQEEKAEFRGKSYRARKNKAEVVRYDLTKV